MGFFNKPDQGASTQLAPLSKERIKAALESKGWSYKVDADGDIAGGWENGVFWFLVEGQQQEILMTRGIWYGKLTEAELAKAADVAAEWNREKFWPKTFARLNDEGVVRVFGEHVVDYEHGLTDEQLVQHLLTIVGTGEEFFARLNEAFPEAAEAAKAE